MAKRRKFGKDSEIHKSTGDLFDYVNGGRDAWVAKIEAIRLADVTPERINKWRVAFVKRAGDNPLKQRRARITCNSLMRQAKSLFAPGLLEHVAMHKPQTPPFGGVAFYALTVWLRGKGVTAIKPLHELRKEFGSQLCAKYGIYAASRMLRHSDIAITAQHYLDQKERVTSSGFYHPSYARNRPLQTIIAAYGGARGGR